MLLDSLYSQILIIVPLCGIMLSRLVTEIEKIQERALRLFHNDSYSSSDSLLLKAEWLTMEVSLLRRLAIKVFKALKTLNPDFMHTYFKRGSYSARRQKDVFVNLAKITTFGE